MGQEPSAERREEKEKEKEAEKAKKEAKKTEKKAKKAEEKAKKVKAKEEKASKKRAAGSEGRVQSRPPTASSSQIAASTAGTPRVDTGTSVASGSPWASPQLGIGFRSSPRVGINASAGSSGFLLGSSSSQILSGGVPIEVRKVRSIPKGGGGIFTYQKKLCTDGDKTLRKEDRRPIYLLSTDPDTYLGTAYCKTSVGIYFQIGNDLHFCANIDFKAAHPLRRYKDDDQDKLRDSFRAEARDRLKKLSKAQKWDADDVKEETLVIVCGDETSTESTWIIFGILEFLGMDIKTCAAEIDGKGRAHGFIIKPGLRRSEIRLPYEAKEGKEGSKPSLNLGFDDHRDAERFKWQVGYEFIPDNELPEREWACEVGAGISPAHPK